MKRCVLFTIGLFLVSGCNPNPINPFNPNFPSNVSTTSPLPSPTPTIATDQQLLRSCKNQVAAEFLNAQFRDIQVALAPSDQNGNKIVTWRIKDGASGYCRMNAAGGLVGFVSESNNQAKPSPIQPVDPGQITAQQLNTCTNEVARELRTVPIADIFVYPASLDSAGTALINWETRSGSMGYCQVNRQGQLTKFVVHNSESNKPPESPQPTGDPTPEVRRLTCSGRIGNEWWFNAFYGENGFGKAEFDNFKTKIRQTAYLRYDGVEAGRAIFRGQVETQPTIKVQVSHPAGRLLYPGDQIQVTYGGQDVTGTCEDRR